MQAFPLTPEQTVLCRQMADLAGLGGFIVDLATGRCLWCADEVARIHGLALADCLELLSAAPALLARIDPEDRERYRAARAAATEPAAALRAPISPAPRRRDDPGRQGDRRSSGRSGNRAAAPGRRAAGRDRAPRDGGGAGAGQRAAGAPKRRRAACGQRGGAGRRGGGQGEPGSLPARRPKP